MVWSIIANGVVYVKYKIVYKTKLKLMGVSSKSLCVGHDTHPGCVYEVEDGGECHLPLCFYSSTSLTTHIKPCHAPKSQPFKTRVWEDSTENIVTTKELSAKISITGSNVNGDFEFDKDLYVHSRIINGAIILGAL